MHFDVYDVFYSQFSHQHVSVAIVDMINARTMECIKFITMFTRAWQWTLSLRSTTSHSIALRYNLIIILQLCHDLPVFFFFTFMGPCIVNIFIYIFQVVCFSQLLV
jgi:hypothetical protein